MPVPGHLNPTQRRCLCEARKCNLVSDNNNVRGVLLDKQDYVRHQVAERSRKFKEGCKARAKANVRAMPDPDKYGALARQTAILAAKEQELEDALSGLSIHDMYPPLAEAPLQPAERPINPESKYRIDKEKDMAEYFSRLAADAEAHFRSVKAFNTPPTSHKDDGEIQDALRACKNANGFITSTRQRLVWTDKGRLRRDPAVKEQRDEIRHRLLELEDLAKKTNLMWEDFFEKRDAELEQLRKGSAFVYDSAHHFAPILNGSFSIIQIIIFMVVVGRVILGFSERAGRWLLSMCKFIVQTTVLRADPERRKERYFGEVLKIFPKDPPTAVDQFRLEGKATIYAVCTDCHATYEPTFVKNIPTYPEQCKNRIYGTRCGKLLVRPKIIHGRRILEPIKKYIAFDFHDWVSNLLSRDGYESKMDGAWGRNAASTTGGMSDIFQGSRILEFKGPDGKHFGESGDKNTGRYLFSLGFDFFNPLRNLAAGKKISIGVVALVCLNLPIELRYKPENVFLAGIIPGPKEPSLDAVNPYLKPLVDAFLAFWVGVFLTKTALYSLGRRIICALLLLVCDLPCARKAGGFSACNHEFFCSMCWCTKTVHGYNNFDYNSWIPRTDQECRDHAEEYLKEPCKKKARRIFDLSGIRHSELRRLPYFHATQSVIVDPMHNLFLGLIKEHFQNILGYGKAKKDLPNTMVGSIDIDILPSDDNPAPIKKTEKASVRRLIKWLKKPVDFDPSSEMAINDMASCWKGNKAHTAALVYVAKGVGCLPLTTTERGGDPSDVDIKRLSKYDLARHLVQWKVTQQEASSTELSQQQGQVLSAEEMAELVRDIEQMIKPSWVTSIPTTISSKGPKLKSDQWRMAGLLYLPVTLIRLWSKPDDDKSKQKYQDLLHLTMSLLSAINVITSRTTSMKHADEYLSLMVTYRQELRRLFPKYQCHPNHHMAMHIPEFIKAYGPVHGWWTFPFERMIGILQRISTNYHPGEYEETIAQTWHRRSNLRALFQKQICPKAIRLCSEMFEKLTNPLGRNSLANIIFQEEEEEEEEEESHNAYDEQEGKLVALSEHVRSVFWKKIRLDVRKPAVPLARYHLHGVYYTPHHIHEGNSGILFRGSDTPFRIEQILQFSEKINDESVWVVARSHQSADVSEDPYAQYPRLRAKMWGTSFVESVEVFPLSAIGSHFAKCIVPWKGKEVAVCVSLSRSDLTPQTLVL